MSLRLFSVAGLLWWALPVLVVSGVPSRRFQTIGEQLPYPAQILGGSAPHKNSLNPGPFSILCSFIFLSTPNTREKWV